MTQNELPKQLADHINVDSSGCWNWTRSVASTGYGQLRFGGKVRSAHRLAYECAFGRIDEGLCVLHSCDNRRCCNPAHLWLGTREDNNLDMARKRRGNHNKLSREDALSIYERRQSGESCRAIAMDYGVSSGTVQHIGNKTRFRWIHAP